MIASGADDVLGALKAIRALSHGDHRAEARRRWAASSMTGRSATISKTASSARAFPIEVYNVLGAGDAFMSGFLRGWLGGESLATAATWANACGAFAVSRLLCSPEYPTLEELQFFLKNGSQHRALRKDEAINHIHWATTRRRDIPSLMALAIDHRVAARGDRRARPAPTSTRIARLQGAGREGGGAGRRRPRRLRHAARREIRPRGDVRIRPPSVLPGSAGRSSCRARGRCASSSARTSARSSSNGRSTTASSACASIIPDDPAALKAEQQEKLRALFEAARKVGRELLIEIIAGKHGTLDDDTIPRALDELYALGIKPDWWKLEPQASAARLGRRSRRSSRRTIRGAAASCCSAWKRRSDELEAAFAATADAPIVKGFAVGRTIFADAAEKWLAGKMTDEAAIADMAGALREADRGLACRARPARRHRRQPGGERR